MAFGIDDRNCLNRDMDLKKTSQDPRLEFFSAEREDARGPFHVVVVRRSFEKSPLLGACRNASGSLGVVAIGVTGNNIWLVEAVFIFRGAS